MRADARRLRRPSSIMLALLLASAASAPPITPTTSMRSYLNQLGVTLEDHYVTTSDGYILHVHRLPKPGQPTIFLQHGILASSWCWLSSTPNRSVALALHSRGYDVWMGNSRGNDFSSNHTKLSPSSKAFWNFTFEDMALRDDPAVVEYVASATGRSMTFIGWSQGVTQFMIAAQDPPTAATLAHRVNLFVGLAPVTYLTHSKSLLLTALSKVGVAGARRSPHRHCTPPDPACSPALPARSRRRCALPLLVPLWLGRAPHARHAPVQAHVWSRVQGDRRYRLRPLDGAHAALARPLWRVARHAPRTHALHTRRGELSAHTGCHPILAAVPSARTHLVFGRTARSHTLAAATTPTDGRGVDDRAHDGALPCGHVRQGP